MNRYPYGFRIVGPTSEPRRLVDAGAAMLAYASCDPRAECHKEGYLSAFQFGEDFRQRVDAYNRLDVRGFDGPCWSPWLWFDLDSEDLNAAWKDCGGLAVTLQERYGLDDADLLLFFSGSKGFHVGLLTSLCSPEPSPDFHRVARRMAENMADAAKVTIDTGVYDKVRAFRAPNSRHPKTGLHKRCFTLGELLAMPLDAILKAAREPAPFTLPTVTKTIPQAAADWAAAALQVEREAEALAQRRAATDGTPTLNRATLEFIREGATKGDRHRLLYSAARNLAEFACPPALAHALLAETGLDCGLAPRDVARQIDCGLADGAGSSPPADVVASPLPSAPPGEPSEQPTAVDSPIDRTPPPGAKLYFIDAKMRSCGPHEARQWTWEGATRWHRVSNYPPPGAGKGGSP